MPINTGPAQNLRLRRCGGGKLIEAVGRKLDSCSPTQPTPDTLTTYAAKLLSLRQQSRSSRQEAAGAGGLASWFKPAWAALALSRPGGR